MLGVLRASSRATHAFSSDDLHVLDIIASLAAVTLRNRLLYDRMEELSIRDSMTGLYLNRYFQERLREETARADLLLHVVDASSPDREAQMREVNQVLAEVGAERVRQILVFNKIDLAGQSATIEVDDCGSISRVRLSALSGAGLEHLRAALDQLTAPAGPPLSEGRLEAA